MACEISYAAGDSSRHIGHWPAACKKLVDVSTEQRPKKRTEHEQHGRIAKPRCQPEMERAIRFFQSARQPQNPQLQLRAQAANDPQAHADQYELHRDFLRADLSFRAWPVEKE